MYVVYYILCNNISWIIIAKKETINFTNKLTKFWLTHLLINAFVRVLPDFLSLSNLSFPCLTSPSLSNLLLCLSNLSFAAAPRHSFVKILITVVHALIRWSLGILYSIPDVTQSHLILYHDNRTRNDTATILHEIMMSDIW